MQQAEPKLLQPTAPREEFVASVCGHACFHRDSNRPEPQGVQDRPRRGAAVHRMCCKNCLMPQNRMTSRSEHAEAESKELQLAPQAVEEEREEERTEAHRRQTLEQAQEEP